MRILIIEDEQDIAVPLKKTLERRGYVVDYVEDGESGLESASINQYDCILLDLNLPKLDGIEFAKKLRDNKNDVPILMLTARSQQYDKVIGFESGADDYLTKPFHLDELLLRIRALIKRNSKNKSQYLEYEKILLDLDSKKVYLDGKVVVLNLKEFGIIEYLLRNKGKVISTEELLEHVWDSNIDEFTQTVKTNIKTLRKKIDPVKKVIRTLRGAGYIIG